MIALTANLNPWPLVTAALELSIVNTSPTWYPVPTVKLDIPVTTPLVKVTEHCAFSPEPVNDINGILLALVNAYPVPPVTISKPVDPLVAIGAPWPSITPIIELSSASFAVPVLIFLPIGNTASVLVPDPSIVTLSFLGNERSALSEIICVFKLPGTIGEL